MNTTSPPFSLKKAVVTACIGNFGEWFDFALFGFFAVTLSHVFFPATNDLGALLATFATFSVAFFFRPVGAAICGRLGDRYGRKYILSIVVITMSVATFLIGVLPGYESIGWASPILLVVIRVVQGLAIGGEFAGAVSFLTEYAPEGKRGFYGSWSTMTANVGMAVGAITALLMQLLVPTEVLNDWAWRVPFIVALPIGISGLVLRLKIPETPAFVAAATAVEADLPKDNGLRPPLSGQYTRMAQVVGMVVVFTILTYVFISFMPAFLSKEHGLEMWQGSALSLTALVVAMAFTPYFGALSDRIGRRPILLTASWTLVVLAVPIFMLFNTGVMGIAAGLAVLGLFVATFNGVVPATFAEMFPTRVRYTAFGISYQVAVALFGATAPFVLTLIVARAGATLAPAIYITAAALVTALVCLTLKETVNNSLDDAEPVADGELTHTAR